MASGTKAAVAGAIKALLDGTGLFQATYLDDPFSFGGLSPVAVIQPYQIQSQRHAAGTGLIADVSRWLITVWIDRTQQDAPTGAAVLYQAIDTLQPLFNQHVELGVPSSDILVSKLDGQIGRFTFRQRESSLYRCFDCHVSVEERYTVPITS